MNIYLIFVLRRMPDIYKSQLFINHIVTIPLMPRRTSILIIEDDAVDAEYLLKTLNSTLEKLNSVSATRQQPFRAHRTG